MPTLLLTCATTHGHTAKIASRLADALRVLGIDVDRAGRVLGHRRLRQAAGVADGHDSRFEAELDRGALALAETAGRLEAFESRYRGTPPGAAGDDPSSRLPSLLGHTMLRRPLGG